MHQRSGCKIPASVYQNELICYQKNWREGGSYCSQTISWIDAVSKDWILLLLMTPIIFSIKGHGSCRRISKRISVAILYKPNIRQRFLIRTSKHQAIILFINIILWQFWFLLNKFSKIENENIANVENIVRQVETCWHNDDNNIWHHCDGKAVVGKLWKLHPKSSCVSTVWSRSQYASQ